jgi:ribosomal protein S19
MNQIHAGNQYCRKSIFDQLLTLDFKDWKLTRRLNEHVHNFTIDKYKTQLFNERTKLDPEVFTERQY